MKKKYISTLFLLSIILQTMPLKAGILYVNHYFVEDLIEKKNVKIRERALIEELKYKLYHNPHYIEENSNLLESYVRLYQKHKVGKWTIGFLLRRNDGRAHYKEEFIELAPFIANIMKKKRSRPAPRALQTHDHPTDFTDEFLMVPQ